MESITLTIAIVLSLFIFYLRPLQAFCLLCVAMVWYPSFLTVDVGSINFTVTRILSIALMLKLFIFTRWFSFFRWNMMDTLILSMFLCQSISLNHNEPFLLVLENQSGYFVDVILAYFFARYILTNKEDMIYFFKILLLSSIPLAFIGLLDSITGFNPYNLLRDYSTWDLWHSVRLMRHGFYRSSGSFAVHIVFGLYFSALFIISFTLWYDKNWRTPKVILISICMLLGALSSISSAPIFACFIGFGLLMLYPLRSYWPYAFLFMIISILFLEVISNRHFYEIPTRFAYSGSTAYYRLGLIEEAFSGGMDDHWLFGFGFVGIGPGNNNIDFQWQHKDFTNDYILKLVRFGLVGLIPYILLIIFYYYRLFIASRAALPHDQWIVWCIASVLIAWNIAMLTVGALEEMNVILYILIGLCANLPNMLGQETVKVLSSNSNTNIYMNEMMPQRV